MARTKQTALKSTGAPSRRVALTKPKTIKKKKIPILNQVEGNDVWCCGCGNGGMSIDCDYCLRTMCDNCIHIVDTENLLPQPDVKFRCVSCHLTTASTRKEPFHPLYRNDQPIETVIGKIKPTSIRANYPRVNTESIAVIELRLADIPSDGSPSISVKNDLGPYFKNPSLGRTFYFSEFLININPDDPKSLDKHQNMLSTYVNALTKNGVKRLLVFLYTHCNPENGDLHCMEGVGIEVKDEIIGPDLNMLAKETHSVLVLNVCGGIWASRGSLDCLKEYAKNAHFNHVIGFTEPNFFPHLSSTFLSKLSRKIFVECFSIIRAVPDILSEEEGLGAHTSVVVLSRTFGLVYFWCHSQFRPWGDKIPLQCGECHAVRTLSFQALRQPWTYKVTCNECGWTTKNNVRIENGVPPKATNDSVTGWGNWLLYGQRSDVEAAWKAPRKDYDKA